MLQCADLQLRGMEQAWIFDTLYDTFFNIDINSFIEINANSRAAYDSSVFYIIRQNVLDKSVFNDYTRFTVFQM